MKAQTDHPVHELISTRFSPYGYSERAVSTEDLASLFEAARWAPSSYNEQPWAFIVGRREQASAHAAVLSCLVDANQAWAKKAPVLVITAAHLTFGRNGKPNRHAFHDVGLAVANLTIEATSRGLYVHQMAGIHSDKAAEVLALPDGWEALTGVSIGYRLEPGELPDELRDKDGERRGRNPLKDIVFGGKFGEAADFADAD